MFRHKPVLLLPAVLVLLAGCSRAPAAPRPALRIFAAASLTDVLERLRPEAQRALDVDFQVSPASSGTLAKQIESGAKADLMLSASPDWIDYLQKRNLIEPATRRVLLSNRLVAVVPKGSAARPHALADLARPEFFPLAIGDPTYVPAGKYAKETLEAAGVWDKIKDHTAPAPDVRAALAYVQSGQCPAGLVYATDAVGVAGVEQAFEAPAGLHEPIRYVAAVCHDAPHAAAARRLLEWLASPPAQSVFAAAGFTPPEPESNSPAKTPATKP